MTKSGRILTRAELLGNSDEVSLKILVAKDSWTKAVFAHVVDKKGVDEQNYVIDRLMEGLQWLGFSRLSLRSDNENAIIQVLNKALVTARVEVLDDEGRPPEQITEEHSARYDSQSNGEIGVAVRDVKALLAANKLCLESRLGRHVPNEHAIMTWLVEHVAWILTTRRKGTDGFTSYQRVRGRDYLKREVAFAESILCKLPRKGPHAPADLQSSWRGGLVLGYSTNSSEYWVFSEERAHRCRDIKRRPGNVRWDAALVESMNVHRHDLHRPREPRVLPAKDLDQGPRLAPGRQVQRILLKRQDFVDFGLTAGCPKCDMAQEYGWGQWGTSN